MNLFRKYERAKKALLIAKENLCVYFGYDLKDTWIITQIDYWKDMYWCYGFGKLYWAAEIEDLQHPDLGNQHEASIWNKKVFSDDDYAMIIITSKIDDSKLAFIFDNLKCQNIKGIHNGQQIAK